MSGQRWGIKSISHSQLLLLAHLSLCTSVEGMKWKKSAIPSVQSCSFEFQSRTYRIGVDLERLCATATVQIYRHSILFCFWHIVTVRKRYVHLCVNRLPGEKSFFKKISSDMVRLCQLYSVSKSHSKREYKGKCERNRLETWTCGTALPHTPPSPPSLQPFKSGRQPQLLNEI